MSCKHQLGSLKLLLGEMADLLLNGQNVRPTRLFRWQVSSSVTQHCRKHCSIYLKINAHSARKRSASVRRSSGCKVNCETNSTVVAPLSGNSHHSTGNHCHGCSLHSACKPPANQLTAKCRGNSSKPAQQDPLASATYRVVADVWP